MSYGFVARANSSERRYYCLDLVIILIHGMAHALAQPLPMVGKSPTKIGFSERVTNVKAKFDYEEMQTLNCPPKENCKV